jgi:hypothetical protein
MMCNGLYYCEICEQTKMSIQNDNTNIYTYLYILISLLLRNKVLNSINKQYNINYNCITFLVSCYIYSMYVRKDIKITNIQVFTGYYTIYKCKKYMNELIKLEFITLAGNSYFITDKINIILKDIEKSYNTTLYNFCSLHNIDL